VAGLGRWRAELLAPTPHFDEAVYLEAFRLARQGEVAVEVDHPTGIRAVYLYLPSFTRLGATALGAWGPRGAMAALRAANLLAAAAVAWLAVAGRRWRWTTRLLAALAAMTLSPLVGNALFYGNVTLVAGALALAGLALAARRAAAAGVLLGCGLAVKPVLAAAPWLLAFQRGATGRARLAAAIAVAVAAAATLWGGIEALPALLAAGGRPDVAHNVSLARVAYAWGWRIPPALLAAAALAAGLAVARRRELATDELTALAATVSVLALPLVWPHTLALTLPVQALALERGVERWRAAGPPRWRRAAELAIVVAAIVSVQGAQGAGAAPDWPLAAQGLVTAIPLIALVGLTAAAIRPRASADRAAAAG
jgi:glycosyl transferase family 87